MIVEDIGLMGLSVVSANVEFNITAFDEASSVFEGLSSNASECFDNIESNASEMASDV